MSQPLFESLQNSSSPQEFISSIQEIIKQNDPLLRVKEIIPIILGKKQLILDNNNNKDQQQQMIQSVGELFQWLMPYTPDLPSEEERVEEEIFKAAHTFCATPEVEAFFLEVMIPNAVEEQAICDVSFSVCRLVFDTELRLFNSFASAKHFLEMAARSSTQIALQRSFAMIADIADFENHSARQGYTTEETAKLLLQAFIRAEDEKCLENASYTLCSISRTDACIIRICTEDFASAVLEKLSITKSTHVVSCLCEYIAHVVEFQPECCSFFCTEDAARILLRASELVIDCTSAAHFCDAIGCISDNLGFEPRNFETQEFCAAIVKCLDFATTDYSRDSWGWAVSRLALNSESACAIFARTPSIVEKLHDTIEKMDDRNDAQHLFDAIAYICMDEQCTRPFATLSTLYLLVESLGFADESETTYESIVAAIGNISNMFPEFLNVCVAQSEVTCNSHDRFLKEVTTLGQLAMFLENESGNFFDDEDFKFVKRRSLLDMCEKIDQFVLSREEEEEDGKEDEEFRNSLSRICQKFYNSVNLSWTEIMNHQFLETVVFSIFQHATGKACFHAVLLIDKRRRWSNTPMLSSSMLKVILEKMDEEEDETCFEGDENGKCFFSIGIQILRHAVSKDSGDVSKTFFVDNLNLINRVFKKGYVLGDSDLVTLMDRTIDEIRSFDPRTTRTRQLFIEKESGQRRDRDGNPSTME
jgi:hypothetical protein